MSNKISAINKLTKKQQKENIARFEELAENDPFLVLYVASLKKEYKSQGGRPHSKFPRDQFSVQLTSAELSIIQSLKAIFEEMLGKSFSRGETIGLGMHLIKTRLDKFISENPDITAIEDFMNLFSETGSSYEQPVDNQMG